MAKTLDPSVRPEYEENGKPDRKPLVSIDDNGIPLSEDQKNACVADADVIEYMDGLDEFK